MYTGRAFSRSRGRYRAKTPAPRMHRVPPPARVNGAPMRAATIPESRLPKVAMPMNAMVYSAITRPRISSRTRVWIRVLLAARCSMKPVPVATMISSDSVRDRDMPTPMRPAPKVAAAAATFGAGLIGVGMSRSLTLSLLIMVATGTGFMLHLAASNTLIQTLVREEMRGRVMALYTMAFMGMATFGSLLSGMVAARIGAPLTLAGGGTLCILGAGVFARYLPRLREKARPVYIAKGILPEAAETLREATTLREEVEQ